VVLHVVYAQKKLIVTAVAQMVVQVMIFARTKKCSITKGLTHCYECEENCRKGLLSKIKPYAFTLFAKKYGEEKLLDCLERNEKNGIVYHRNGINGDYDDFDDVEQLMDFILTGVR